MTEFEMTTHWLAVWLADEFHNWIDGDDPVAEYILLGNSVDVFFESGVTFNVLITELPRWKDEE